MNTALFTLSNDSGIAASRANGYLSADGCCMDHSQSCGNRTENRCVSRRAPSMLYRRPALVVVCRGRRPFHCSAWQTVLLPGLHTTGHPVRYTAVNAPLDAAIETPRDVLIGCPLHVPPNLPTATPLKVVLVLLPQLLTRALPR